MSASKRLTQEELHRTFVTALSDYVAFHSAYDSKPLEVDLHLPFPTRVRLYIYNTTHPPGGRPINEHKIQLIVPGQSRGERGSFDVSDGRIPILCGYVEEDDVFILWDASLHYDFAHSKNVQVRDSTIVRALAEPIAYQRRALRSVSYEEIVVVGRRKFLREAILERFKITSQGLTER